VGHARTGQAIRGENYTEYQGILDYQYGVNSGGVLAKKKAMRAGALRLWSNGVRRDAGFSALVINSRNRTPGVDALSHSSKKPEADQVYKVQIANPIPKHARK